MKTMIKYICICLILMSFVKSDYKGVPENRIFSIDQPIKDITVDQDDIFCIKVAGNPTTGYSWFLNENSDENNLKALNLNKYKSSEDYVINKHPEGFVGVGGVYYFNFKGVQKGNFNLLFVNKRPWEETNAKERRITINVE